MEQLQAKEKAGTITKEEKQQLDKLMKQAGPKAKPSSSG